MGKLYRSCERAADARQRSSKASDQTRFTRRTKLGSMPARQRFLASRGVGCIIYRINIWRFSVVSFMSWSQLVVAAAAVFVVFLCFSWPGASTSAALSRRGSTCRSTTRRSGSTTSCLHVGWVREPLSRYYTVVTTYEWPCMFLCFVPPPIAILGDKLCP